MKKNHKILIGVGLAALAIYLWKKNKDEKDAAKLATESQGVEGEENSNAIGRFGGTNQRLSNRVYKCKCAGSSQTYSSSVPCDTFCSRSGGVYGSESLRRF